MEGSPRSSRSAASAEVSPPSDPRPARRPPPGQAGTGSPSPAMPYSDVPLAGPGWRGPISPHRGGPTPPRRSCIVHRWRLRSHSDSCANTVAAASMERGMASTTTEHERLTPTLASLPASRREILVALRKRGEAGAVELAEALGVTVSAVRQHVTGLTAVGLVEHRAVKGGPGRPRHLYRLSAGAEGLFPKYYSELTNELLSYVEDEAPEVLERIFERRRRRRVQGAVARLDGRAFPDRVAELADRKSTRLNSSHVKS